MTGFSLPGFGQFTHERAFWLFSLSLLVGSVLILLNLPGAWGLSPAIPVLLYGVSLRLASVYFDRRLSSQEKDSPYFLGFILTLVALLMVFLDLSDAAEMDVASIVGRAGAAILVTVVGLFMRQLLVTLEPDEEIAKDEFEKLRTLATKRITDLVKEEEKYEERVKKFQEFHDKLLVREERVLKDFVEKYEAGLTQLSKLVKSSIETVSDGGELSRQLKNLAETMTTASSTIGDAMERVQSSSVDYTTQVGDLSTATESAAASLTDLKAVLKESSKQVGGLSADAASLGSESIDRVRKAISDTLETIKSQTISSGAALESAGKVTADRIQKEVANSLSVIAEDVKRIDDIVDQFVRVLARRLDNFDDLK